MKNQFELSYSINSEENTIYFYYIIRKSMGTKIKIKLPDHIKDTSQILADLTEYFENDIEDFDKVCLEILNILPDNLDMYPEITILYNRSNKDVLGNVDLDNLDNYDGDMFMMHNGKLDSYVDFENRIIIRSYEDMDKESKYSCYIIRSGDRCDSIPLLYESDSNSPHVSFCKEFIHKLDSIRTKKVDEKVRRRV